MSKKASSIAKGIAILMMLMHHLFFSAERIATNGHGQDIIFLPFTMAQVVTFSKCLKICVAVFVFITAYGTFKQISKQIDACPKTDPSAVGKTSSRYALEHIVKLLVNFWVVFIPFVALGCFVSKYNLVSVYADEDIFESAFNFLADFFGMAAMFDTPTFNPTWWYMSLALLLIVIMPALVLLARRIGGVCLLGLSIAFPLLTGLKMESTFWLYAPTVAMGIMFAQYDLFSKLDFGLKEGDKAKRVVLFVVYTCLLLALAYVRRRAGYVYVFNPICAVGVCQIARLIEPVSVVFNFFGKHSMNIFFMHTFFYSRYFGAFVYSFHWFGLVFIVLAGASLLCSIAIEFCKKVLRINDARDRAVEAIRNMKVFSVE